MTRKTTALRKEPAERSRIWYQSFVDPQEQSAYTDRLQEQLTAYASPSV